MVTPTELARFAGEVISIAEATGKRRILVDCVDLTGGHTATDLYGIVSKLSGKTAIHSLKEAVLLPADPHASELPRFWETVSVNHGLAVRNFSDRDAAIAWLLQ